MIRRLSPPGKGLRPYLSHRLTSSLLLPLLLYGADLFSPNVTMLDKMEVFCRKVLRWVTNCFSSTPTTILTYEACLPPLNVLSLTDSAWLLSGWSALLLR